MLPVHLRSHVHECQAVVLLNRMFTTLNEVSLGVYGVGAPTVKDSLDPLSLLGVHSLRDQTHCHNMTISVPLDLQPGEAEDMPSESSVSQPQGVQEPQDQPSIINTVGAFSPLSPCVSGPNRGKSSPRS